MRTIAPHEVVVGRERDDLHAGPREGARRSPPRAPAPRRANRSRNAAVAGVDLELLARSPRRWTSDDPDVRQLALARVDEPDREQLVALVEEVELALPAGRR